MERKCTAGCIQGWSQFNSTRYLLQTCVFCSKRTNKWPKVSKSTKLHERNATQKEQTIWSVQFATHPKITLSHCSCSFGVMFCNWSYVWCSNCLMTNALQWVALRHHLVSSASTSSENKNENWGFGHKGQGTSLCNAQCEWQVRGGNIRGGSILACDGGRVDFFPHNLGGKAKVSSASFSLAMLVSIHSENIPWRSKDAEAGKNYFSSILGKKFTSEFLGGERPLGMATRRARTAW